MEKKKEQKKVIVKKGLDLSEVLLVVFIILKLTGFIQWSWLWVLSPLWIPWCIGILILIVLGIFFFVRFIKRH